MIIHIIKLNWIKMFICFVYFWNYTINIRHYTSFNIRNEIKNCNYTYYYSIMLCCPMLLTIFSNELYVVTETFTNEKKNKNCGPSHIQMFLKKYTTANRYHYRDNIIAPVFSITLYPRVKSNKDIGSNDPVDCASETWNFRLKNDGGKKN